MLRIQSAHANRYQDDTRREIIALLLVDEESKTGATVPTITLVQGHEKHRFNVYSISGLYEIFNALLDCEISFMNRRSERGCSYGPHGMPSTTGKDKMESNSRSEREDKSVTTADKKRKELDRMQVLIQSPIAVQHARQNATKKRRHSSYNYSTGRSRKSVPPSPLRAELFASETDL